MGSLLVCVLVCVRLNCNQIGKDKDLTIGFSLNFPHTDNSQLNDGSSRTLKSLAEGSNYKFC